MEIPKIKLPQKPTYIKLAEDIDYYQLFSNIEKQFDSCFLFESLGEEGRFSRYSIIGFDPAHIISAKQKSLFIDGKEYQVENPYFALRKIIPQSAIARSYAGGLVGYIGYDAMNYFEPSLQIKPHPLFDQFCFGVYTDGLILDKHTQQVYYFYYQKDRSSIVQKLLQEKTSNEKFKVKFLGETMTKKEHERILVKIKEEIIKGNTFQCQIGFKAEFKIKENALKVYERLRRANPSPFMYYLKFGSSTKIIGASPELLFRLQNGEMSTFPLAGTIKRGKSKAEDKKLARKLLSDPKEIAEHNMLVDLHRNDIGRVAKFGTVKLRSLMDIKRFSHVQHIGSEIVGIIKNGEDMFTALASNFPAGTLCGAPKIESIKIIESLEKEPRGPYGGAVGHFGFNGDCTFAIAIRSLFISGNYAFTQASGGIVYDSVAEKEYEEVQRKLVGIKEVLYL
ncbi:MAG: anthranilate synthase component I family protein [Candidatus Levybacteria bacterium]|nr:anthranilate synthase component I family protein [Candidatus Levybacteria bacterium]